MCLSIEVKLLHSCPSETLKHGQICTAQVLHQTVGQTGMHVNKVSLLSALKMSKLESYLYELVSDWTYMQDFSSEK